MSKFDIMPKNLRNKSSDLKECANILNQYSVQINDIKRNLGFSVDLSRAVGYSLQSIADSLRSEARGCDNLSAALSDSLQRYEGTEEDICGKAQITWRQAVSGSTSKSNNIIENIGKLLYKTITAAAGPFGTICDIFKSGYEGNDGDVISDIIKLVGGLVKNTDGTGIKWDDWFGINVSEKGPWESAVGKYTDFSTGSKAFSTVCNWASAIVTSGYSNYEEFGEFSSRFWEETATETLIKVGEGVLVGAGVAMMFAGAPAFAVGAATAAVTVLVDLGLDAVVSWATGGSQTSWTEAVSDFVCDMGEQFTNWAKGAVESIGNKVSDGLNSIKNAVQSIGGNICKWGSFSFG